MKKVLWVFSLLLSFIYADTTLCGKDDMVILSCDIKKKKLSICKQDNQKVVYKYGTLNKIELEINTVPWISSEQFIRANYEEHLRFHNKGYDYIVYANEFLVYDRHPNDGTQHYVEHHGVYVVKNKKLLVKLTCNKIYPHMKGFGKVGNGARKENYIGYY